MVPIEWNADAAEMEDVCSSANSSEKSSKVHSSANNPAPPECTASPARNTVGPDDGSEKPAPSSAKKGVGGERVVEAAAGLQAARQGPARTATGKTPLPTLAPASQTPPTSSESASDVGQEAAPAPAPAPDARAEAKAAVGEGSRAEPEPDAEVDGEDEAEVEAEAPREHPATDSGTTTNSSATSAISSSTSIAVDAKATHVPASSASATAIVVEHVCSSPFD